MCVKLPKENVFCPNNASETYIFNSWRHQKLLLVANQQQDSTFLFEINSEDIGTSRLISQLKLLPVSQCALRYQPLPSKTPSSHLLFTKSPFKSTNCLSPPFRQFFPIYCFFREPPNKSKFLVNRRNFKIFHP